MLQNNTLTVKLPVGTARMLIMVAIAALVLAALVVLVLLSGSDAETFLAGPGSHAG